MWVIADQSFDVPNSPILDFAILDEKGAPLFPSPTSPWADRSAKKGSPGLPFIAVMILKNFAKSGVSHSTVKKRRWRASTATQPGIRIIEGWHDGTMGLG